MFLLLRMAFISKCEVFKDLSNVFVIEKGLCIKM